jgi:hypothetical protein
LFDQGTPVPLRRALKDHILPTTNWPELRAHEINIAAAINALRPGDVVEIKI